MLGKDTKTDLALLKVTPKKPLPAAAFGNSANMKVGDWVMAIGNPFGLGGSVTVGIISAKQRDINSGPYDDYLQTDAAINKGNSGGPLFNMDGEVIGVNTAIISPTGGSIGIGFAVPADTAVAVVDQLKQFGETRRGWLGVRIQSVTEDIAELVGIKENTGALVAGVTPDGPAAKAGIEPGDVITQFDGKEVSTMRGLPRMVSQTPIGKQVDVEALRKGEKKTFKPSSAAFRRMSTPTMPQRRATTRARRRRHRRRRCMGMRLAPITDELRQKYGLDKKVKGARRHRGRPASQAGRKRASRPGTPSWKPRRMRWRRVEDVAKSIDKVRKAGRKAVLLRVEDAKGEMRFIAVPIE